MAAGDGLSGGGTLGANFTISHDDTSSIADVDNSLNSNFLKSLTFDEYGHVLSSVSSGLPKASKAQAEEGTSNDVLMTPLRTIEFLTSQKAIPDGLATLNGSGKILSEQLPSYVDDVIEGFLNDSDGLFYEENTFDTEITGESGKIYINLTTGEAYR